MRGQQRRQADAGGVQRDQQAFGQRQAGECRVEQGVVAALRGGGDFFALVADLKSFAAGRQADELVDQIIDGVIDDGLLCHGDVLLGV
ncbi:hypothetical protein D3C78_1189700 [compost metagenome]